MSTFKSRRNRQTVRALLALSLPVFAGFILIPGVPLGAGLQPKEENQPAEMTTLIKGKLAVAEKAYKNEADAMKGVERLGGINIQTWRPERVQKWSLRWLQAECELSPAPMNQVAAFEKHVKRMEALETNVRALVGGPFAKQDALEAEWYRLNHRARFSCTAETLEI